MERKGDERGTTSAGGGGGVFSIERSAERVDVSCLPDACLCVCVCACSIAGRQGQAARHTDRAMPLNSLSRSLFSVLLILDSCLGRPQLNCHEVNYISPVGQRSAVGLFVYEMTGFCLANKLWFFPTTFTFFKSLKSCQLSFTMSMAYQCNAMSRFFFCDATNHRKRIVKKKKLFDSFCHKIGNTN